MRGERKRGGDEWKREEERTGDEWRRAGRDERAT